MQVPGSSLVAAVERVSRALEQLVSTPPVVGVLEEVVCSARASVGAEKGAIAWFEGPGELLTHLTPPLSQEAVAACARRLLEGPSRPEQAPWVHRVEEPGADPGLSAAIAALGCTTLLAMPVLPTGDGGGGVLLACFATSRIFSGEDFQRFALHARLAGVALERNRWMASARSAALQARAEAEQAELLRLMQFQAVTEAFGRALTREDVGQAVLEVGLPAVGAVCGTVCQRTADGRCAELIAAVGLPEDELVPLLELAESGEMPSCEAFRHGAPVWVESMEEVRARYARFAERMTRQARHAFAFLPLKADQRTFGLLVFGFAQAGPFNELQRTLMRGLARQCAQAFERARLYEDERAARLQAEAAGARLQLLADAGVCLSSSPEWEKTVAEVARLTLGRFADGCAVDFLGEDGALRRLTVLHVKPERALLAPGLEGCVPEQARPSAIADVVRTGRAQRVTGLVSLSRAERPDASAPERGTGSFIVAPLVARQRTLGAMTFVRGAGRPHYDEADLALAEDLAARAGLAIDNARLLRKARAAEAESRRSAARLSILVEVGQLLAEAGLDLPAVLDVLARKVSEVIGDGCVIQLLAADGEHLEPVAIHHPEPEARWVLATHVHGHRTPVGEGLHGGVVSTGRTALLPEVDVARLRVSGTLPEYLPFVERYGPQSLLVVPLAVKGRVSGSLGVVRDAAERPYGQEDKRLLESLADRAALAIEDARMYGAATEAVRLRDDFLSVAGHELKTPLSALRLQIQMLARMARDVSSTPGLVERMERAERTSARLGALIDELLDVGRIGSGKLELRREEVDLAALAREAVARMSEALSRAGCEVRLMADTPVVGWWDRLRLEQVAGNLLSNAAKYGRGQRVEVVVEAEGDVARLSVSDQGIGIAPEDQARIFERFERAVPDRQFHGLGLGLWISREIVAAHAGRILERSSPGQGASFTVALPRGP